MKNIFYHSVLEAIKTLHYRYGKGDIIEVMLTLGTGGFYIVAKCTSCKPHSVRGTYDGTTLRMYRHQIRVTII